MGGATIVQGYSLKYAGMAEWVDTRDLGSRAERRAGSRPVTGTIINQIVCKG